MKTRTASEVLALVVDVDQFNYDLASSIEHRQFCKGYTLGMLVGLRSSGAINYHEYDAARYLVQFLYHGMIDSWR